MMFFAFFAFVVVPCSVILYHKCTKKYLNPYKLIFVFGKKVVVSLLYLQSML